MQEENKESTTTNSLDDDIVTLHAEAKAPKGANTITAEEAPIEVEEEEVQASTSVNATNKKTNREKFDSGLGDEIIETQNTTSPEVSESENRMEVDSNSNSSASSDEDVRPNKRQGELLDIVCGMKWRFVTDSSSDNENTQEEESKVPQNEIRTISSPYSSHMRNKIQQLPLPSILKNYLNFYREF